MPYKIVFMFEGYGTPSQLVSWNHDFWLQISVIGYLWTLAFVLHLCGHLFLVWVVLLASLVMEGQGIVQAGVPPTAQWGRYHIEGIH